MRFNSMDSRYLILVGLLAVFSVISAEFQPRYMVQDLMPIDRFNPYQFYNRYYIDEDSHWDGGPIFIHVAGPEFYQADIRMELSHFFDLGREEGAVLVLTEHRFYGSSRPTLNTSLANLQYLDSRYAVADVAKLITYLKEQYGEDTPVIAHGFDIGGALAVWLRQRYPDLVDGVWVSHAAVHARKDFGEYLVNIGNSIRSIGGQQCYTDLEAAFTRMGALHDMGAYSTLEENFSLCSGFTGTDRYEEAIFFAYHALFLSEILRYSHVYGIDVLCGTLDNAEDKMLGLATFFGLMEVPCLDLDAFAQLEIFRNEEWDSNSTEFGLRQISYQFCREFGWFRSSSYADQPFGSRFPVEIFEEECGFLFGPVFNGPNMEQMISQTNQIFGGLTPNVTKVYFTDGELDPARSIGVLEPYQEEIYVDIIPGYAAGAELFPMVEGESEALAAVHERARQLIHRWINEAHIPRNNKN